MTETTACLSDLLEKGMKRMDELQIDQCISEPFHYSLDGKRLLGCCALGAILLGAEFEPQPMQTMEAVGHIEQVCPQIGLASDYRGVLPIDDGAIKVFEVIYRLNDGIRLKRGEKAKERSLPEILTWLKGQNL